MDSANVAAIGLAVSSGFHLHPYKVPTGFNYDVIA